MATQKPAYQQREALIRAGFEVAEKLPASRITTKAVVSRAKLSQRSLAQQFGDLERFAATLQSVHYEEMRSHTLSAIYSQNPSAERILNAVTAYLDFAFQRRGLRAWMSEVRTRSPVMQAQWQMDNRLYAQFVASEFALIGWPQPLAGARLFIAAVLDLSRQEQQSDSKLPAYRRTMERFLRTYEHPAGFAWVSPPFHS